MADKNPTKTEILGIVQAQLDSAKEISERLVRVEKSVDKQESKNDNIIYAVLIGLVFIVVTVAAEVILSNYHYDSIATKFSEKVMEIQNSNSEKNGIINSEIQDLNHKFELLRVKNPYLQ